MKWSNAEACIGRNASAKKSMGVSCINLRQGLFSCI